ncbi:D-2-hydroxyacid dehydrogenase [Salinispira pacifica]|uniref:D-3-phosphoglycerate dehydrogenase n=1 Tax=Salinispira pacifica TaxID=1307761 RepID=V5WFT3_9SPIO|nr:D-2-hydroxyacid dehydrogenase [Salinispira pacifica]AHC14687.1 D-3-phosphoglycerate dehydrogenase [Salinispira pacifica]
MDGHTMNPGDLSWDPVAKLGDLHIYPRMKAADVVTRAADAEVILTNKVPIGRDMMDLLTRLKYIGVLATGYNTVDSAYAHQLGLPVTNIPGYSRDSVAQMVFAYILHVTNMVWDYNNSVKNGDWETSADFSYIRTAPVELSGKTLGIIGYGDIGRKLGEMARAFGMEVLISRKQDGTLPGGSQDDINLGRVHAVPMEELFERSSFISLHTPLNSHTREMVDSSLLSRIKPGTVLLNTSRGGVIHEESVLDALDDGKLICYAADVYDQEPPKPASALIHHPKTLFTPHIAWASRDARERAIRIAADNIQAWMDGKPVNVVNDVQRGRV